MKKNYIWFCLLLCFLGTTPTYAQQKSTWINSVFWEISGKDIQKKIYVFGTHHLYKSDFIEKNNIILEKLRKSDVMIGEIIFDLPKEGEEMTPEQSKQMSAMMKSMTLQSKTLKDFLSKKEYEDTEKVMKEFTGMGLNIFATMKPIVIYQYIMIGKYLKGDSKETPDVFSKTQESIDVTFQETAKSLNKQVIAFETIEEQMKILYESYSLERQVELLKSIVYEKKDKNAISDVQKLTNLYESQDINEMEEMVLKESTQDEYNILLKSRNLNWLPIILQHIKNKKSAFIAVGAGHLSGQYGILELLKKEGYTIKPLTIKIN